MNYFRAEKGELFDHLTDQVTLSEKKTRWEMITIIENNTAQFQIVKCTLYAPISFKSWRVEYL